MARGWGIVCYGRWLQTSRWHCGTQRNEATGRRRCTATATDAAEHEGRQTRGWLQQRKPPTSPDKNSASPPTPSPRSCTRMDGGAHRRRMHTRLTRGDTYALPDVAWYLLDDPWTTELRPPARRRTSASETPVSKATPAHSHFSALRDTRHVLIPARSRDVRPAPATVSGPLAGTATSARSPPHRPTTLDSAHRFGI